MTTMQSRIPGLDGMTKEQIERGRQALSKARESEPALTVLAQHLTGNPEVKVVMKGDIPTSMTDGKVVWVKPSLSLADPIAHIRPLCGQRDEDTDMQRCPACERMDDTAVKFNHEVAHIAFGSFDKISEDDKIEVVRRSMAERGAHVGTRVEKLLKRFERRGEDSYIVAANLVSPYLPMLVNALEDARVNRGMYGVRPGLKRMFQAKVARIMVEGVETPDGGRVKWNERSLDEQAMIGTYILGAGYDELLKHLDPSVQAALADPAINMAMARLDRAKTVETVYAVAFPILEALRAHGFCKREDDPEDDEDQAGTGQQSQGGSDSTGMGAGASGSGSVQQIDDEGDDEEDEGEGQGAGGGNEGSEENDDKSSGGDDDEADDAEDDDEAEDDKASAGDDDEADDEEDDDDAEDEGSGDDEGDDEDEDEGEGDSAAALEAVRRALEALQGHGEDPSQASWGKELDQSVGEGEILTAAELQLDSFDEPSENVLKIIVHEWDKPVITSGGTNRSRGMAWNPTNREWQEGYEQMIPQVSESVLGQSVLKARLVFAENRAVKRTRGMKAGRLDTRALHKVATGNDRVFERRVRPDKRDYHALLGMDVSGSTGGRKVILEKRMAYAMGELFQRVGVNFSMYAHTAMTEDFTYRSGSFGRGRTYGPMANADCVDIFTIKRADEAWAPNTKARLDALTHAAGNLDGHTLEFYRKALVAEQGACKLLFYVTDGAMPAANYHEELAVLQREIKLCRQLGIQLIGIGIGTDSPKEHGLDTIQVDTVEDLPRVVQEVERRLTR